MTCNSTTNSVNRNFILSLSIFLPPSAFRSAGRILRYLNFRVFFSLSQWLVSNSNPHRIDECNGKIEYTHFVMLAPLMRIPTIRRTWHTFHCTVLIPRCHTQLPESIFFSCVCICWLLPQLYSKQANIHLVIPRFVQCHFIS